MSESAVGIDPLHIDRLRVDRFGGLRDLTIDLGEGLVVLHGPNESGKTTLATLATWLLVGPTGTAADALRFGRPDERVGGRLEGRLGAQDLRCEADFKLLKNRHPNPAALSIKVAGASIDLDRWRGRLGGIDGHVYGATYRMWGATLHESEEILGEIAQVALAGLAGSRRVHEIAERLEQDARQRLTSRAQGADSWQQLQRQIAEAEGGLRRIAGDADEYRRAGERVAELTSLLEAARHELAEHTSRSGSLGLVASVAEERRIAARTAAHLAALDPVPHAWRPIIDDVDGLAAAIGRVDSAAARVDVLDADIRRAMGALALEGPSESLTVTHQVVTTVRVAQSELDSARQHLDEATAERNEAARTAGQAATDAETARSACPELGDRRLDELRLDEAALAEVHEALDHWRSTEHEASRTESTHAAQVARLEHSDHRAGVARDAWDRFGTGLTAQQWRVAPPTPEIGAGPWPVWAIGAGVALVIAAVVAAVLVLPRGAAALASAAAIALLAALTLLAGRRTVDASATQPRRDATAEHLDQVVTAANEVIAADDAVDQERRELGRVETELRHRRDRSEGARQRVEAACADIDMPCAPTAEATARMLTRIVAALAAHVRAGDARRHLSEAEERADRSAGDVERRIGELRALLEQAGVPAEMAWGDAADQIEALRQLTELRTEHRIEVARLASARDEVARLLAPVGESAHPAHPQLDLARARQLAELDRERTELERRRDAAARTIEARLRDDGAARAILANEPTEDELDAELTAVGAERERIQSRIDDLLDERGRLTEQMAQLEAADHLAAARLHIGELRTQAEDRLRTGAISLLARSMLTHAAAERRRTHQPALVERAGELLRSVVPDRGQIILDPDESGSAEVTLLEHSGLELPASRLSTGMQALSLLALRLATAEIDAERRGVRVPIICDDPLVHLDDDRANSVLPLLARAASDGHQVIVLTCQRRTVEAAVAHGARVVPIGGAA